jgi:hypothetical protein
MKKPIIISVIMPLMLLAWSLFSPSYAQDPANEEKPTFYRLTPGVYVNPWPRFTVTYPKDWVERYCRGGFGDVFRAATPGPAHTASFVINVGPFPLPLDKFADGLLPILRNLATEVTLIGDKPSRLRDGTPAREVEVQMVYNGVPVNSVNLGIMKGDVLVCVSVSLPNGKIGEDLKAIPYSLEFQPGKDDPVKVPPDVQEFLDNWRNAIVSHDVAKLMTHYSDRYLNSGWRKGEVERYFRQIIGGVTSSNEISITDFIPEGDRVYLAGFVNTYIGKLMLGDASIIKENGEWKFYGNQRDVSP